jgi:hypothetical protein
VQTLQQLEKRSPSTSATYADLLGTWRLLMITGTQKAQKQASSVLQSGRFLPRWLRIELTYCSDLPKSCQLGTDADPTEWGRVVNRVQLGAIALTLTGPARFYPQRQILAFDFTHLKVELFQQVLYQGGMRGGATQEAAFVEQTLKTQAFFKYFWIQPDSLAARGKGGGLALWVRE